MVRFCQVRHRQKPGRNAGLLSWPSSAVPIWGFMIGLSMETCLFDMCSRPPHYSGYCTSHYNQKCSGKPLTVLRESRYVSDKVCTFEGCGRAVRARNLCKTHYETQLRGDPLKPIGAWGVYSGGSIQCSALTCEKPARTVGLCDRHMQLKKRYSADAGQISSMRACALCGSDKRLVIDHDHACCPKPPTCGKCNRGCICTGCNVTLGRVQDSVERLKALIDYLENPPGL